MHTPRRLSLVLVVVAGLVTLTGCATPRAGWTYAPAPSVTPVPSAQPTDGATPAPSDSGAIHVSAASILFEQSTLAVPAGVPFKIEFENKDSGVPHNVAIHDGSATGPEVFKGDIFNGVATRTYDAPALAAGPYAFVCTVHLSMIIDVTAR